MTSTYDDFSRAEAELDASKLPPGSPAGETASEHVVEVYGTFAGPNQPAAFFEGKCSCGATWRTPTEVWVCPKSVPEPVPTEGDGVPPVFNNDRALVEQVSKLPFSRRYAIYRNIKNMVITAAPSAPEAAAAPLEHRLARALAEFKDEVLTPSQIKALTAYLVGFIHEVARKSAAPIAPAAGELIQDLIVALGAQIPSSRNPADRCWCSQSRNLDKHGHSGQCLQARNALARAEEYRKGAKNA